MAKRFVKGIAFAFLACGLISWSSATADEPPAIGFIMDLTGPAAPLGEDCRQGFEVARLSFGGKDSLNRNSVRFVIGDSKGDPKTAVTEFSRMISSEHALAVIISRTHLAAAVNPVSRQAKVSLLASSANPRFVDENEYAFRVWVRADREGDALATKAFQNGARTLALITTEDDYLLSMSASFLSSFKKLGGEVVFDEKVDKDFMDFGSLVSKLRMKNPDAVFMNVGIPQLGVAYRRMHELGFRKQFFSSYWIFKDDVLAAAGREAVEGVIAVEMDYRKPKFEEAFKAQFGHPPLTSMAYSCYVGTAQVLQVLKGDKAAHTSLEMFSALRGAEAIQLLDGIAVFKNRELQTPLRYETYRSGAVHMLE